MYTLEQRATIAKKLQKAAEPLGSYRYAKIHKHIKDACGIEIPHTTIARVLHGSGLGRDIKDSSKCYAQNRAIPYIANALGVSLTDVATAQSTRDERQTLLPLGIPEPTAGVSIKINTDSLGFSVAKAKVAIAALKAAGLPTGEVKAAILAKLSSELDLG